MWKCEACGACYGIAPICRDDEGDFIRCPSCHGEAIEEYKRCKHCGEWKSVHGNFWLPVEGLCNDCINKDVAAFNAALNALPAGVYDRLCEIYGDVRLDAQKEIA